MNKEINQTKQCSQCRKEFAGQDVYLIGIKQKNFFCYECAKNIKSECMWCGKELAQKEWKILGGGSGIKSEEGKLAETIDYDNKRGERYFNYYLICEETREHGIRPNQSCPSRFNDWWVAKKKQKRQEKLNKGWKECQGKSIYYSAEEFGTKKDFIFDCLKLVPPGEKYCKDDRCVYFTAKYKGIHSEEKKRIADKWNRREEEKYQKANEWWNSLSLAEKQAELKKEEGHSKSLGLERQKCWVDNWLDKNSILFENDKLHYDNMDKIPPSFLDRFGLAFQWESVWKNDSSHANLQATAIQGKTEADEEISDKKTSLQQAKEMKNRQEVEKLEQEIKELESRQKNNSSITETKPTFNYALWISIGAILLLGIGGLILYLTKKAKNIR